MCFSSFVLDYSKGVYQDYYKNSFLSDFNHGPLTKGDINISSVKKIINQLNEKCSEDNSNISFDSEKIEKSLEGGSCSAIALRIAEVAISLMEKLDMTLKEDQMQLVNKIAKAVEDINKIATKKNNTSSKLREDIRSIQSAFNTITIDREKETTDVSQDKVKSIASYYNLTVTTSTEEVLVANNSLFEIDIYKQLKSLENGVHLLRIIQFEDNHKLETKGHSVVYIKQDQELELYFDTQLGFYSLAETMDKGKKHIIYNSLQSAGVRFQVDTCKFHKLERKISKKGHGSN